MAAVQQQTTQLEFHQAMADFKVMFPEMDHDVIERSANNWQHDGGYHEMSTVETKEKGQTQSPCLVLALTIAVAVLRANQGAVDATIDQLLAMSTDNENERLRNEMEKKEKQQRNSPQPSSAAVPISSASVLASIKTAPSQTSHPSQLRQTSSPLVSQQQSTPSAGPIPVSSLQVSSSHSPGCCIPGSTASAVPSGNSDSPSKNKEVSNQQLNPSPVTSATSSPRKADERDANVRLGPNGESSSDREDVAQMIELDTDADQKDGDEKIPLRIIHGWEPPLLGQLPDDFLRISVPSSTTHWTPNSKKPQALMLSQQLLQQRYAENQERRGALLGAGGAGGDPDLDRFLEDERIALFLQNEEFMAELRWNKDFLSTLEKDQLQRGDCDSPPEDHMGSFPLGKSLSSSGHDEDALFKERLRNMGKVSRKKFAQLARVFTGRKKRSGSGSGGAKHILSQGPAPSRDNLLLNAEPLLPDEDDEEDVDKFDGDDVGSEAEEDMDPGEAGRCRRGQRHRLGGGERRKRSSQRVGGDGKEDEEEDEGGGDFHHHHLRESHNGGVGRRGESRD